MFFEKLLTNCLIEGRKLKMVESNINPSIGNHKFRREWKEIEIKKMFFKSLFIFYSEFG